MGYNATIRARQELEEMKLLKRVGLAKKRSQPHYSLTLAGKRIIQLLRKYRDSLHT
jgi:hypothetical protein